MDRMAKELMTIIRRKFLQGYWSSVNFFLIISVCLYRAQDRQLIKAKESIITTAEKER